MNIFQNKINITNTEFKLALHYLICSEEYDHLPIKKKIKKIIKSNIKRKYK